MVVNESYSPVPAAANSTTVLLGANGGAIGGFLCVTAGSVKLTYTTGGGTIVDTMAVAAGTFYPMPFTFPPGASGGVTATLSGGAAGTFGVI